LLPAAVAALLLACAAEREAATSDTTMPAATSTTASGASCWLQEGTLADAAARPSPLGEVRFSLGGQEALLCYGRPSANSRKIMGELVPFGSPWRLGANEATVLHLPFAGDIGGVAVEPGSYSLYAVPAAGTWEFFVNRQAERWGIPINAQVTGANVGSFSRPVATTAGPVEQLTFSWQGSSDTAGELVMEWESTRVTIPVQRTN
jgi:hypothetical protein